MLKERVEIKHKSVAGMMLALILVGVLNVPLKVTEVGVDNPESQILNGDDLEPFSVAEDPWNFSNRIEWSRFAYFNDSSAEVVIGLRNTQTQNHASLSSLTRKSCGEIVNTVSMGGEVRAVVADIPLTSVSSFVTEMQAAGLSRYIEPNIKFQADFDPNDPYWPQQWGPRKIEAHYAWNTTIGDPSVLVAVIDTGIDYNHPDLADNYVTLGYDWVNNDTDPMDDHDHGTHCAGIIAATLNNSLGIAGVAQVQIMAEKGLDSGGSGKASDLANAIIHAVDQGADILSNSWRGYSYSNLIHDAVEYAQDHGVLVVAAAGNEASSMKGYPAAYDEVVAVTATDQTDDPASFTSYGKWVDVAAPGVDVYSTVLNERYENHSGTSMACPHAAGVAALIWSEFPSLTLDEVRLRLQLTADDLGDAGFDVYYGYGRVNARRAVEPLSSHDLLILEWKRPAYVEPGSSAIINTTVLNFGSSDEAGITVQLRANGSTVDSAYISYLGSVKSATVSCMWSPTVEGRYHVESYVVPVSGETVVENNVRSAYVNVRVGKYIRVPEDCSKIQEAVDLAGPGETIKVASGTYYERVSIDTSLKLVGENRNTTVIDGNGTGIVVEVTADNVEFRGFTVQNSTGGLPSGGGVVLFEVKNCLVTNNTIINNFEGVTLWECTGNNSVYGNIAFSNEDANIGSWWSAGRDTISDNAITGGEFGVIIVCAPWDPSGYNRENTVSRNLITKSKNGVSISADDNIVVNNTITLCSDRGIRLGNYACNTIRDNRVEDNQQGIVLEYYASSNRIYHNDFVHNIIQTSLETFSQNTWDDGYPCGGNYWSDYAGVDLYSGPYQNLTSGDGLGDTPYIISENNKDNYPLMHPLVTPFYHPVAKFTYSPKTPYVNETVTFNASTSLTGWNGTACVPIAYTWDFDDGNITTVTNPVIFHIFRVQGVYTVNLTVTCDDSVLIEEGLASDSTWQNVFTRIILPPSAKIVFEDDFEYNHSAFCAQWQRVHWGGGYENAMLAEGIHVSPTKSLILYGNEGGQMMLIPEFTFTRAPLLGFDVYVRVEEITEDSDDIIIVSLTKRDFTSPALTMCYTPVRFKKNGTIFAGGGGNTSWGGQFLQSYVPGRFYHVRGVLDRSTETFSVWIDGVLEGENIPASGYLSDTARFFIYAKFGENTTRTYFDDVTVYASPVGPAANFAYWPPVPYVNDTVIFYASASTPGWNGTADVPIVSYEWDFGDGSYGNGMIVNHTYTIAGTYTVDLTVTCQDDSVLIAEGLTSDRTWQNITIGIESPPLPPFTAIVVEDNFESYDVGTFPNAGGWELWSSGDAYPEVIVNSTPTKSLQLSGSYGYPPAAVVTKHINPYARVIGFEAYVRVNQRLGDSDRVNSRVGFVRKIDIYNAVEWYASVSFSEDAGIYAGGQFLGSYDVGRWYKVDVILYRSTGTFSVWIDDKIRVENFTISGNLYKIQAFALSQSMEDFKTYFDEVKLFEGQEKPQGPSPTAEFDFWDERGWNILYVNESVAFSSNVKYDPALGWSSTLRHEIVADVSRKYSGNFSGRLYLPEDDGYSWKDFANPVSSGNITVVWWAQNQYTWSGFNRFFEVSDETGGYSVGFHNARYYGTSYIAWYCNGTYHNIQTYSPNVWYKFELRIDLDQRKYSIYINDVLKVPQADANGTPLQARYFVVKSGGGSKYRYGWIDNITVTTTPDTFVFTEDFEYEGAPIVSYEWDFGDGSYGEGMTVNHKYATNGTYNVTLTVTNTGGAIDTTWQTLTVRNRVHIKADGSVEPSTTSIQRDGDLYTFTDNIYCEIAVERSNIIIDGNRYTLQGTGAYDSVGLYLYLVSNVTIKNLEIKAFEYGIWLERSSNNTISGNNITENGGAGIWLSYSSDNSISGNNITNNYGGVLLWESSNYNTICGNNITNNDVDGIALDYSSNNTICGNSITTNNCDGIYLYGSSSNTICGNNITNNDVDGIALDYFSNNNTISGNTITNNDCGIYLNRYSSNNTVYHNNFVDNAEQVHAYMSDVWDDGYPSGGNYWSDYTGEDLFSGPYQDEIGSDGIGDTPYVIDANNQDNYPLMTPSGPHNVGITNVTSKSVVGQGFNLNVSISIINHGLNTETFNITVYANTTILATLINITLAPRNSATIMFPWNTTGVPYGNYTISAYAHPVQGETYTTDNTYTDGWIKVSIPGDADGDGYVSGWDLSMLSDAWMSQVGEPNYNPHTDFNLDDLVSGWDLSILSDHWMQAA